MEELNDHRELLKFVELLMELKGVTDVKVITGEQESWIGLRVSKQRPAGVLLQQVNRAALGFGLDVDTLEFGILAD